MKKSTSEVLMGSLFLLIYFFNLNNPSYRFNPFFLFFAAIGFVQLLTGIFSIMEYYQKKVYLLFIAAFSTMILVLSFIQAYSTYYTESFLIYIIIGILTAYITYNFAFKTIEYLETMKEYKIKLQMNPDDIKIWNNYGNALTEIKEYKRAIESYDRALKINPEYTTALYNKGIVLSKISKYKNAIEYYDKVLEIDPDNTKALINKGNSLTSIGKYKEAIGCYDKTLEIEPENIKADFNKEVILKSKDKCDRC